MTDSSPDDAVPFWKTARAYFVHAYTASGVVFAFLAAAETSAARAEVDPRWVFVWLALAVLVDATDGPLARRWEVKRLASRIDGRVIDDVLDYLTFAFIPLLLIWRMDWVPEPQMWWVVPAMFASLLGFANTAAKQEEQGFFLGFPSYWNIVAFYVGLWAEGYGTVGLYVSGGTLLLLAALTLLPVRFVYPNQIVRPWREIVIGGTVAWFVLVLVMLPSYPPQGDGVPAWLMWVSLIYPAFYIGLSFYLDVQERKG